MKIHEVMTVTGLTKKAINYYAKQGLISPFVDVDNNYRDFNSDDVIRLKQISALREFDMSVREIKDALLSREYFANALNLYSYKLNDRIMNMESCENILGLCLSEMKNEKLQQLKKPDDKPDQYMQIVSLPEMTFFGVEYKKLLSFEAVYQSVITFKESVNTASSGKVDDISL